MPFPSVLPILFALLPFCPPMWTKQQQKAHELFRGCAVKLRQRSGSDTLIGQLGQGRLSPSIDSHRALFFGLGGNVYLGDQRLASFCAEDKVFNGNDAKMTVKHVKLMGCEKGKQDRLLYRTKQNEVSNLSLYEAKKLSRRANKCQANSTTGGIYEVFGCTKELCGNNTEWMLFVRKRPIAHNEFRVEEVIIANVSEQSRPASELACVKRSCPANLVQVEEIVRTIEEKVGKLAKNSRGGKPSQRNKLFRECAIERSDGKGKLESLVAHARIGGQVLFFSMAGKLYIGHKSLAKECEEDKYFNRTDVPVDNANIGKAKTKTAQLVMELEWKGRKGGKDLKERLNLKSSNGQCASASYDLFLCPADVCAGRDKILLVKKQAVMVRKRRVQAMVYRGKLMVRQVLVANASAPVLQTARAKCRAKGLPTVEAVVRRKSNTEQSKKLEEVVPPRFGHKGRRNWTED